MPGSGPAPARDRAGRIQLFRIMGFDAEIGCVVEFTFGGLNREEAQAFANSSGLTRITVEPVHRTFRVEAPRDPAER